jgi:tetratricopeptide (TPR) repeat protein
MKTKAFPTQSSLPVLCARGALAFALSGALALPAPVLAHVASPADDMSEADRMERAKELFGGGQASFDEGDFNSALAKWEEAYNVYAPALHLFNFNIGQAAFELGDCVKAKTAYQRFLDLVPDHPSRGDAQARLLEIERSGCATVPVDDEQAPIHTTTPSSSPATDYDDAPILSSKTSEREETIDRERKERDSKKRPLLVAGAVTAGVGVLSVVGGGVALGLANREANNLADLASPNPATGFPGGSYSDDDVFRSDRNTLPNLNRASIALFIIGPVLVAAGAALIVTDVKKRKKAEQSASRPGARLVNMGPTMLPGGGGAAATVRF